MIWIILISFIVALFVWILLVPVIIHINTEGNRYYLVLPAVLRAEIVPADGLFRIRGWILFIPYSFNPFTMNFGSKKEKKKKKKSRRMGLQQGKNMFRDLLGSFRIRKLDLNLDTDDFVTNAYLVPAFSAINRENINMQVNYEGELDLLLDVRTRIGKILWTFFKYNFKSKFNN